jgi:hypothetical protein
LHKFIDAFGDELEEVQEDLEPDPHANFLINAVKGSTSTPLPPGDIHRVMSKNSKHPVHMTCIEYKVSYHKNTTVFHPLS